MDNKGNEALKQYLNNYYFDINTFLKSITIDKHLTFMGDFEKNVWYVSDAMKEHLGEKDNIVYNMIDKWRNTIATEEDVEFYVENITGVLQNKKELHDLVYRVKDQNDEICWIRCVGLFKWNEDKTKPLFFSGTVIKLNDVLLTCPATGFMKEQGAVKKIGLLKRENKSINCVCFKLSGIALINEENGREFADALLSNVANNLLAAFKRELEFFRLDGLRFLAISTNKDELQLKNIGQKIAEIVEKTYIDNDVFLQTACLVGIMDKDINSLFSQDIINEAINLLEVSKITKKDFICFSEVDENYKNEKNLNIALNKDIKNNFKNFRIVIQPIVSMTDYEIVGGEILLRYNHKNKAISPAEFIPLLEKTNLINPVGKFVFEESVKALENAEKYIDDLNFHFNLSYKQINDDSLVPFIEDALSHSDIENSKLVMELTEHNYNSEPKKLKEFTKNIEKLNMKMALDDYGTGYSSLEILLKYPVDIVKIDRSIMKKMAESEDNKKFIIALVYSCHKFGKLVCIEGVETEEELQMAKETNCDFIQGFYFYKPLELDDFYNLIKKSE